MRKFTAAVLVSLLAFVGGCKSNRNTDALVVWHWMSDRDNVFQKLAAQYEKETGKKVIFELYAPSEAYSQKVRAAAQARTLPDIFGVLGESRDLAGFINAGLLAEISGLADHPEVWRKTLFERALQSSEFKAGNSYNVAPGLYGVPIDVTTIQMVYNKKLLAKAGLDPKKPPRTWAQFVEANRALRKAGIPGFVSGWGETWLIDAFANNYAFNVMGEQKVMDTYRGKVPYTDPDWLTVFKLFETMRDEKILTEGAVIKVNKQAEQDFANERAAFAFNGSWCVNVYYGMNPELDYGVILPPKISDKYPMRIWGGAGASFMVSGLSDKKQEAVRFLQWLTAAPQQVLLAEETRNLPANKESLAKISPILAEFADDMDSITHPSFWPVTEVSEVLEAYTKGIQSILIGESSVNEVARQVQQAKEREKAKP